MPNANKVRQQIEVLENQCRKLLDKREVKGENGKPSTFRKFTEEEQKEYGETKDQLLTQREVLRELESEGLTERSDNNPSGPTARVSYPHMDTREEDEGDDDEDDDEDDEAPVVRTSSKTKKGKQSREYSLMSVIRSMADGKPLTGMEAEISVELAKRSGKHGGIFVPMGALSVRDTGRYDSDGRLRSKRDLSTTTGAALIRKNYLTMIEFLRAKSVLSRAGARFLTDSVGTLSIPRQTGTATLYWVGEGNSGTPSNPTFDNIEMTPKHCIAGINVTRQFMLQTGIDHENFAREDLGNAIRLGIDDAGLNADGGAKPTGVFKHAGIIANSAGLQGGTNGAVFTRNKAIDMESAITDVNADSDSMAFITSPRVRGYMRKTETFSGTGLPVWNGGRDNGEMAGYPAYVTNLVPKNVTKGTGTNLTKVAFGDWSQLLVAMWGAVEFLVNPYSGQMSGTVTISAQMAMDIAVRHDESIVIVSDVSAA